MNRIQTVSANIILACALLSFACSAESGDREIRVDLAQMADDFLNYRAMQGFDHEMSLAEAYRWQDEMVMIMEPALGGVVGYKSRRPRYRPRVSRFFRQQGIRGVMLSGMFRTSGTAVKLTEFRRGFPGGGLRLSCWGFASINEAETDLEILAGLDAIIPFAEIPDPYYEPDTQEHHGDHRREHGLAV